MLELSKIEDAARRLKGKIARFTIRARYTLLRIESCLIREG